MNENHMQLLNNALRRITQLENLNLNETGSNNNQSTLTLTAVSRMLATTSRASGLTGELQSRFPCLTNLQNSASPSINSSSLGRGTSSLFGSNKKKRKRGSVPATSLCKQAKQKAKPVHKDLVLIPDPKQTTVPTHSARVLLESKDYVPHSFPFDRDWDGIELQHEINGISTDTVTWTWLRIFEGMYK